MVSLHLEASEVEHADPGPQEVAVAAAAPGGALLESQAAAKAEPCAVAGLQQLALDDDDGLDELLVLVLAARRADAEVEVEVGAPGRLELRRVEGDGGVGGDGAVRDGVDAPGEELAADVRVPVVLDLVVRPSRQPPGDQGPSAPNRDEAGQEMV